MATSLALRLASVTRNNAGQQNSIRIQNTLQLVAYEGQMLREKTDKADLKKPLRFLKVNGIEMY